MSGASDASYDPFEQLEMAETPTPTSSQEIEESVIPSQVQDGLNREAIYCPQCPSKILLPMTGRWLTCVRDLPRISQIKGSAEVLTDTISSVFEVRDPFTFENIGFSKSVQDGKLKYLTCADCEVGPVGWQDLPGDLCYIALERVRFGQPPGHKKQEEVTNGVVAAALANVAAAEKDEAEIFKD